MTWREHDVNAPSIEAPTIGNRTFPVGVMIPKNSRLERIESSYGPLDAAVPCGLSNCGTAHKRGYVVVFTRNDSASSERGIIGHVCGRREFKETWTQAVARHRAEERAAELRAELNKFLENAAEVEPRLQALIPGMQVRSAIRSILLIDARDFMRECANACRSRNGRLGRHGYGDERITYKLEGQLFFLSDDALAKAKRILNGIARVRRMAEQRDATPRQLRELLSGLTNLRVATNEIEREAKDGIAALQPSNFEKAIRVLDEYETSRVRMIGTVLEVRRLMAGNAGWTAIADLANPQMPGKVSSWSW